MQGIFKKKALDCSRLSKGGLTNTEMQSSHKAEIELLRNAKLHSGKVNQKKKKEEQQLYLKNNTPS